VQAAIDAAASGDTIVLAAGGHIESGIAISKSLTIRGVAGGSTLDAAAGPGSDIGRVFAVPANVTVVLRDLSLRYGDVPIGASEDGGAIHNLGHLTLERVVLKSNGSDGTGGAVYNGDGASLVAVETSFDGNSAQASGGHLFNSGTATLFDCVLTAGSAGDGGAITNRGALGLYATRITHNHADAYGGGIYQAGDAPTTFIYRGGIALNESDAFGGGLAIIHGTAELVYVDLSFNDATGTSDKGGGAYVEGTLRLRNSTVSHNTARFGGGIYQSDSGGSFLENTTMSSNSARDDGGGIYVKSPRFVNLYSSTVAANVADSDHDNAGNGGGLFVDPACVGSPFCSVARARLRNSIVADNVEESPSPAFSDCHGDLRSQGYNLIRFASAEDAHVCTVIEDLTGVIFGVDPLLDGLEGNGGVPIIDPGISAFATETHALGNGSLAIDAGNPTGCTGADGQLLVADQREAPRVDACDLGSFEHGSVAGSLAIFSDGFESGNTSAW
jgi:predicted outer membrane repeat protein